MRRNRGCPVAVEKPTVGRVAADGKFALRWLEPGPVEVVTVSSDWANEPAGNWGTGTARNSETLCS